MYVTFFRDELMANDTTAATERFHLARPVTGLRETWSPKKPRMQKIFVPSLRTLSYSERMSNAQNLVTIS
jgi:hypothetical protein